MAFAHIHMTSFVQNQTNSEKLCSSVKVELQLEIAMQFLT